jgi:TatD DNase family protein
MTMLYDAHNHYQDRRLDSDRESVLKALSELGIKEAVVNGSNEDDWENVAKLARQHEWLKPSFGLHPWYVKARTPAWQKRLRDYLLVFPNAAVGEIGLDRWIQNPDIEAQITCFRWQIELAAELDRPATIHCLRAWGLLEEQLRTLPLPKRGFLLHSYGGPAEMIPSFVKMGAYFSLSPYFGHPRKAQQLTTFAAVPLDLLLAETDAPDMCPPDELNLHPLHCDDQPINHPANLQVSYDLLARACSIPMPDLLHQVGENYRRLFGGIEN